MSEVVEPYLYLLLAFVLVLVNAFFVAAEFAIVKMRASRLETLARRGNFFAQCARHAVQNLDEYLSASQLGITIASLGLGWVGEPAFADLLRPVLAVAGVTEPALHSIAFFIAFVSITVLHIVLGELAPKIVAIQKTEAVVLAIALPLRAFFVVFYPALRLLNGSALALLRLLGMRSAAHDHAAHSEEELRLILAESAAVGAVSGSKRRLLENVFNYSLRTAKEIMVPRADIAYLSLSYPWTQNLETIRSSEHTRYPLCTLSLDHVIGMVHIKDLFAPGSAVQSGEDMLAKKRDILFVPETMTLDDLQRQFQQKRLHMAVVVDEYGGTSGLVTLEDVLEELVGEIQDEFDREPPKIERRPDGAVLDGLLLVTDVNRHLGLALEESESRTVGGYITEELGRIARVGDRVQASGRELRVVEMKGRRVSKVLVAPPDESGAGQTGGTA